MAAPVLPSPPHHQVVLAPLHHLNYLDGSANHPIITILNFYFE
jgi:hypothetical protein